MKGQLVSHRTRLSQLLTRKAPICNMYLPRSTQPILLKILLLVAFTTLPTEAKLFDTCEFETELIRNKVPQDDLGSWICLAKLVSSMNSSRVRLTAAKEKDIIDGFSFGIFQISEQKWCAADLSKIPESGCKILCSKLLDDDIKDDINCALKIANNASDSASSSYWPDWKLCKEINGIIAHSCDARTSAPKPLTLTNARIVNLKDGEQKTFLRRNEPEIIHCQAEGQPTPQIRWDYNETEFPNLSAIYVSNKGILIFPDVNISFEGNFSCVATNTGGTDTVTIKVKTMDHDHNSSNVSTSTGGFSFGFVSGLVMCVFFVCLVYAIVQCRRINMKKEKKVETKGLTMEEINEFRNGDPDGLIFNAFAHENARFQAYNNDYEILDDHLIIETDKLLGSGAFGLVYRGWKGGKQVAVKTIKPTADKLYIKALLSELKVMIYLGKHENIVNLIGAKTMALDRGSLHIVVELCELGNLESFIRDNKGNFVGSPEPSDSHYANVMTSTDDYYANTLNAFNSQDLIIWSCQIAAGMEYLATKKVIHGDLATRNILLAEKNHLKITDFGLSRQLYDYTNYVKKQQAPLPWRWMAIESLRSMTFSPQSDIWSFAVTLWEIYTLGEVPYAGLSWTLDFVGQLENGLRLLKPKHCPDVLFYKMLDCWHCEANRRPDIAYMHSFIENMIGKDIKPEPL